MAMRTQNTGQGIETSSFREFPSARSSSRSSTGLSVMGILRTATLALALCFSGANAQIGGEEDLCSCSPTVFDFTLNFDAACPGNLEIGDAINDLSCFTTVVSEDRENAQPVVIDTVTILELNNDGVINSTTLRGPFMDGDVIEYTSISSFANLTSTYFPFGLQMTLTGENSDGATVINFVAVEYTNACDAWPVFPPDAIIGWVEISTVEDALEQYCPAVPATPTDAAPTDAAPTDAAPTDSPPTDAAPTDAPPTDPAPTDAAPTDAAPTDAPPTDPAPTDTAPTDAAPTDAAPTDSPPTDAAPTDAPPTDPAPTDGPAPTDSPPTDGPPSPTDGPPAPTDGPPAPTDGPPAPTDGPPAPTSGPPAPTDGPVPTNGPPSPTQGPPSPTPDPPSPTPDPPSPTPKPPSPKPPTPTPDMSMSFSMSFSMSMSMYFGDVRMLLDEEELFDFGAFEEDEEVFEFGRRHDLLRRR